MQTGVLMFFLTYSSESPYHTITELVVSCGVQSETEMNPNHIQILLALIHILVTKLSSSLR